MKKIDPKTSIKGVINVPPDKSISHRAVMLGSLAEGTTVVNNILLSKDCMSTINCFKEMGIKILIENNKAFIKGKGLRGLAKPLKPLNVGNSGTTIRLMSGILAGQNFSCKITGDSSLVKRPMDRIIFPLSKMGASIISENEPATAPLKIVGNPYLKNINYKMPIASAQVKSAILLASLYARGASIIEEITPSRNHSETMLKEFGVNLEVKNNKIIVKPPYSLTSREIFIPGDISSAAFFIVACLILKNSNLTIKDVGINMTRTGIISALKKMGANIKISNERYISGELVGDIKVQYSELSGTVIEGSMVPKMIDEIPIFVVASLFAKSPTVIKNASELKFKESNRIDTISEELNKMGANIKKTIDGMVITPIKTLNGATLKSHNDHRIAMSVSIAAICAKTESILLNPNCVDISFPNFFEILDSI